MRKLKIKNLFLELVISYVMIFTLTLSVGKYTQVDSPLDFLYDDVRQGQYGVGLTQLDSSQVELLRVEDLDTERLRLLCRHVGQHQVDLLQPHVPLVDD